ncbi:MAG TPA: hypothetical protein PKV71_16920, partial [Calditrichia bacterium]|nr:hypothetical protein [Calditrichia bacterium]
SEGSPWYNFFEEIPVGGIDRDHARGLITEPVSGIYRYDEAAIERILLESDCIPYRIQKICVNVIARLIHEQRRRVTEADVEAVLEAALAGIET